MQSNQGLYPEKAPEERLDSNLLQKNNNLRIFEDIKAASDYPSKNGEKSPLIEKKMPQIMTKFFIGGVPPCMDKDRLAELFRDAKESSNLPPCQ
jgi:hypothetical protein